MTKKIVENIDLSFWHLNLNIPLSTHVDREKAQATYKNGVLQITLPKTEKAAATQKIAVKAGE